MIKFHKMHGIGNDYIFIDCFESEIENPESLAIKLSDRHFGVGSDGVILIKPSNKADCFMDMYNADGSRGKMCGNGIRCVAKYLYKKNIIEGPNLTIDTLSGVKKLTLNICDEKLVDITVDMGIPKLIPADIPILTETDNPVIDFQVTIGSNTNSITCVSMGNPHSVIFVEDVNEAPVEEFGTALENYHIFPEKTNVEFIQIIDEENIKMRVWERGSGETLACGTGACAAVVACFLNKLTGRRVNVSLPGGKLKIFWDEKTDIVYMTGTATYVYEGIVDPNSF